MTAQTLVDATSNARSSTPQEKEALLQELLLEIDLGVQGISVDPAELGSFGVGSEITEQRHLLFDMNKKHQDSFALPEAFYLPHGLFTRFRWDADSRYRLRAVDGKPVIFRDQAPVAPIEFYKRDERVHSGNTSDGTPFDRIASFDPEGSVHVFFSNECDLKGTGQDCKFCNINSTADAYRAKNIFLKTPRQVAEVYAAAYHAGYGNHIRLTGGFIPERREVDYYLDVAEEIKERTGLEQIHGLAVIGAPQDLTVIEKYKEAGWSNLSINIEIWNRDIFNVICPGKAKRSGGWEHWVKALEYAVQVFGKGNVRSNIVAGLEPKASTLEGLEYLASIGVICYAGAWCPNPGSELEGHRSPEAAWHYDLTLKSAGILAKHGFTTEQLYSCAGFHNPTIDAFRIQAGEAIEGFLPLWKFPRI
jgi:Radical SAM superfamily